MRRAHFVVELTREDFVKGVQSVDLPMFVSEQAARVVQCSSDV
jgi:hypothetical protein